MLFESFPPRTGLCGVLQYWSGRCSPRPVTDVNPQGKTKHLTTPTFTNITEDPPITALLSYITFPGDPPSGPGCLCFVCEMLVVCRSDVKHLSLSEVWAGLDRNVRIGANASHTDTPALLLTDGARLGGKHRQTFKIQTDTYRRSVREEVGE